MEPLLVKEAIQWDVRNWSKALYYWEEHVNWDRVQNCLELGGREGGLSLWLALKGKQVVCSDVGDVHQSASTLHARYQVSERVRYESIDAMDIPYEDHFDLIVFKSILGVIGRNDHIAHQYRAMEQVYKALKPGGQLIFAENLSGSLFHRILRNRFVKWGKIWRYVTINEMKSFLCPFRQYAVESTGFAGLLGRTESQRNLLARIDQAVLNHCFPASWKYISYGLAIK